MGIPYKIQEKKYKEGFNLNETNKRYKEYLKVVNGTENLTFEEVYKRRVNKLIQNLLNDSRLDNKNKEILNEYYLHIVNNMAIDGVRTYLTNIKILAINTKKPLNKITKQDLQKFFLYLKERTKLKERSIFDYKLIIKIFYKWMYNIKNGDKIPDVIDWIKLKRNLTTKTPEEVITPEEIKKMAQVCDNPRDSAILLALFETGARAQEFLRLKMSSISFDKYGAIVNVPIGKSGAYNKFRKLRLIFSVPSLKKWIECHPCRDNPEAYLWITLGSYLGNVLSKFRLNGIIKKYARLCGVPIKKAYTHSFRHSRCYDLISKGFTDKDLRLWFGWGNFSDMPSIYSGAYGLKDTEYKLLKQAGILMNDEENNKEELLKTRSCAKCNHTNSPTQKYCEKCNSILDLKEALNDIEKQDKRNELIEVLLGDPQLVALAKQKVKQSKEAVEIVRQLA